jgi:hypothetical protein
LKKLSNVTTVVTLLLSPKTRSTRYLQGSGQNAVSVCKGKAPKPWCELSVLLLALILSNGFSIFTRWPSSVSVGQPRLPAKLSIRSRVSTPGTSAQPFVFRSSSNIRLVTFKVPTELLAQLGRRNKAQKRRAYHSQRTFLQRGRCISSRELHQDLSRAKPTTGLSKFHLGPPFYLWGLDSSVPLRVGSGDGGYSGFRVC